MWRKRTAAALPGRHGPPTSPKSEGENRAGFGLVEAEIPTKRLILEPRAAMERGAEIQGLPTCGFSHI
jgi:hypothetical protein